MAHHHASLDPAGLLESAQGAQRARVIDGPDYDPSRVRGAQMLSSRLEAFVETAVAVDVYDRAGTQVGQDFFKADQQSRQSHERQLAGPGKFHQDDFVGLPFPPPFDPAAKIAAADQPSFIVIGAIVRGPWVRNLNRD